MSPIRLPLRLVTFAGNQSGNHCRNLAVSLTPISPFWLVAILLLWPLPWGGSANHAWGCSRNGRLCVKSAREKVRDSVRTGLRTMTANQLCEPAATRWPAARRNGDSGSLSIPTIWSPVVRESRRPSLCARPPPCAESSYGGTAIAGDSRCDRSLSSALGGVEACLILFGQL